MLFTTPTEASLARIVDAAREVYSILDKHCWRSSPDVLANDVAGAAALKPADFFGNDDVLYLMEDMATGEIRLSILWEWIHKGATLTADDAWWP